MFMEVKHILLLLLSNLIYASESIISKYVSMQEPLSIQYILGFLAVVFVLGIYATLWQKILTFMPLNYAYLYKSVTILFILAISYLVFGEGVTINNLIGACFILLGIGVLAWKT